MVVMNVQRMLTMIRMVTDHVTVLIHVQDLMIMPMRMVTV